MLTVLCEDGRLKEACSDCEEAYVPCLPPTTASVLEPWIGVWLFRRFFSGIVVEPARDFLKMMAEGDICRIYGNVG